MIPDFDARWYLPPGIHPATMEEIEARFGSGAEVRAVVLESIVWRIDLARVAGIRRIVIDGSVTTDKPGPNDADCALMAEPGELVDDDALMELTDGLPFIEADVFDPDEFDFFPQSRFGSDRRNREKGMIEVIAWT